MPEGSGLNVTPTPPINDGGRLGLATQIELFTVARTNIGNRVIVAWFGHCTGYTPIDGINIIHFYQNRNPLWGQRRHAWRLLVWPDNAALSVFDSRGTTEEAALEAHLMQQIALQQDGHEKPRPKQAALLLSKDFHISTVQPRSSPPALLTRSLGAKIELQRTSGLPRIVRCWADARSYTPCEPPLPPTANSLISRA